MHLNLSEYKLKEMKIEVTYRCTLNCIHCSSEGVPDTMLEMKEIECMKIIKEAVEMGASSIAFSGGEPFLWPGLYNSVNSAIESGLIVDIYSSGNSPQFARQLSDLQKVGLNKCIFSIFGATSKVHERITKINGSFNNTVNAIRYSKSVGMKTEIHFVPLKNNYKELLGVVKLAEACGIARISLLRFVPQGRGEAIKSEILEKKQNLEMIDLIKSLKKKGVDIRLGSPYNFLQINEHPACRSGVDRCCVGPNLNIYPCDAFKQILPHEIVSRDAFNDLGKNSLKDCWEKSTYLNTIRSYLKTPFADQCGTCKSLGKCFSGCVAQKVLEYGGLIKNPDPACLMN